MSCIGRMGGSVAGILLGLALLQVETLAIPLQEAGHGVDIGGRSLSSSDYGKRGFDAMSGLTFGKQKRNFDEIDRAGFGAFVKRNFDEIDRSGFEGFVKRPWFQKKNFDEIDRVGFGG